MNNDRFRFRAWHKSKKMFAPDGVYFEIHSGKRDAETCVIFDYFDGNFDTDVWYLKDIELMQCTGLKDKNDVLIFEGHIVNVPRAVDRGDGTADDLLCKVLFEDGSWLLDGIGCHYSEYLFSDCDWCEIVGNIQENPEPVEQ